MTMSVSAAPQARASAPTYGDCAFAKICVGQRGVGAGEQVRVRVLHRKDDEQQRCRLARGPGDGEQRAADDAADRGRQHDGQRDPRLGGAERVAGLPELIWH